MSDEVYRADWEISSLMCETDGRDQTRLSNELKFWSNSFDRLKFLYDHLNPTEDVNKVKTIGRQKLTKNISLMRCVVLTRGLFETKDECESNEIKLNKEINQLKEQQKVQAVRLSYLEKKLLEENTGRGKLEAMNQELKSTVNKQSEEMKSFQDSNVQLQKSQIYVLDTSDVAFDKAKA